MIAHQALRWLPDALHDAGLPFIELDGWENNQPGYFWLNPDGDDDGYDGWPNGWIWHHTASIGYTPYVKNSRGQTKANLWMGLWSPRTPTALWAQRKSLGSYEPMVMIASSGPANYSNGAGRRNVLTDYVNRDVRFPGPQDSPDDNPAWYGNRYYGATEVVHPGDGSACDEGVWELQAQVAALMSEHWGWSPYRHIGHLDHTRRKIDQRFTQGAPYTIATMQERVAAILEDEMVTRDSKADDGIAALDSAFRGAQAAGVMSSATQPGGVAFNDEIAAFLERAGVYQIAALEARIAALEADGGLQDGDVVKLTKQ